MLFAQLSIVPDARRARLFCPIPVIDLYPTVLAADVPGSRVS
jgi:hypothetical protein